MKHKTSDMKQFNFLLLGFALLFPGIFLATILDGHWIFQVVGIACILIASVVFGASIGGQFRRKK